jgi:hypothetical protein
LDNAELAELQEVLEGYALKLKAALLEGGKDEEESDDT